MKKIKRGIVLRTLSGFLAVWLVFALVSGWMLLRQEQDGLYESMRHSAEQLNEELLYSRLNGETPSISSRGLMIDRICYFSPVLEAGALYQLYRPELEYVTGCSCTAFLVDPDSNRDAVSFSLLELLDAGQFDTLLSTRRAFQARPAGQEQEQMVTLISGWVHGDRLYPCRLVVAKPQRKELYADGHSWDLSYVEIVIDWRFDPEEIWQTSPGWLGSGRYIENVFLNYEFLWLESTSQTYADFTEMIGLAQEQALREQAASQRLEQFTVFRDSVILLHDGLPYNQYYMYAEIDGWEYIFTARADPFRDALPKIAAAWFASLLLAMAAVGLVCRGMCRVYDRQAALEQNRRSTSNALAHDLKTPLALMQGYAENLQFGVKPEKHPHYLAQIQREIKRMDGILGGFLELSRLETAALPLHREPLPLRPLAEEGAERCRAAAELRHITLLAEGEGTLSADREMFERALDNLLSNALRHTPEGGKITITVSPAGLTVENTGAPIPPEALPHLFEAYYTGDRSRSGGGRHGLGLAIVRAIAERHGMRAAVENTEAGVKIGLVSE